MSDNRRKLSNVKLTRKYHAHYLGLWVVLCAVLIALLDLSIYLHFRQLMESELEVDPTGYQLAIAVTGAITLFLIGVVVFLGVVTAHRLAGPYLGLKKTCVAIKEGDLSARLSFRDTDHLEDVEEAFNGMMDSLQQRLDGAASAPAPEPAEA